MAVLNPELLAKLGTVKLRARAVVEGLLSGLHRSPHQGQSVEFAEHKEYAPGDEVRHMDWKAFGKFDKYYIKRFEHETNLRAFVALDASASMNYRSGAMSKLEVGATIAAALSYLLVRQQDAVGLAIMRGGKIDFLPPRAAAGQLNLILDRLERLRGEGSTDLASLADFLSEKARRRAAVYLISDLFDENEEALRRMLQLTHRHNDLAVFHVLDPAEIDFPFEDNTRFLSMEDARSLQANPREIRQSYQEIFGQFLAASRRKCAEWDVDYDLVRCDAPLDRTLLRFLARRLGSRGSAAPLDALG